MTGLRASHKTGVPLKRQFCNYRRYYGAAGSFVCLAAADLGDLLEPCGKV